MGVHSLPRRPVRGAALLTTTIMVGLMSALGAVATGPMAAAGTDTVLRVAQFAEVMPGDAVVVTSVRNPGAGFALPDPAYGSLSPYRRIDPGDYVVAVRRPGDGQPPMVSAVLTATPGAAYTLVVAGGPGSAQVTVVTDDLSAPPPGSGRLRVLDAEAAGAGSDVRGPGNELFLAAGGRAGDYRTVPAGRVALLAGPGTVLPVDVLANQVVTVVLLRGPAGLTTHVQVDAEGPVVVPPGSMDAGLGGTAGGPGRGVATTTFAVLAVVAAGLAVALRRRSWAC